MQKKGFLRLAAAAFFLLMPLCPVFSLETVQQSDDTDYVIKPQYIFSNKAGRDPFMPKFKKMGEMNASDKINISALSIVGITESKGEKAALFKTTIGDPFGYIFFDGVFYGPNDTVVDGISGEIKNSNEVLLVQGDKEIIFTLNSDTVTTYSIRPDQSNEKKNEAPGVADEMKTGYEVIKDELDIK
jgi:hypothetical protein